MFIDTAKIFVQAGQGGSGCASFRREKFVPKGGPDGGDGGDGGKVILKGNRNLHTLIDFKYRHSYQAQRGQHGKGGNKSGKNGKDIVISLPLGTLIMDDETDTILADIVEHDQTIIIARGGRGGKGNTHFATPTNQAPRDWEVGRPGEQKWLRLELKLIADIGLVGFPNAGKSTLLSVISAARPKIADYPFTTLQPNLGIMKVSDGASLVVADIPGLIEGAHLGKGLGLQFLRHIERTRALAYLIDCTDKNFKKSLLVLQSELENYSKTLTKKPYMVLITKTDLSQKRLKIKRIAAEFDILEISSATGENINRVKELFFKLLDLAKKRETNATI